METEKNTENVWKAKQKNKENVENQAYQISQERALEMLEELLEQDQFELLLPEYKLVYMMNDAVESFLVFHGARMTGIYQDDYEGPLDASVTYENGEYVLVVHQDDSVCNALLPVAVSGSTFIHMEKSDISGWKGTNT